MLYCRETGSLTLLEEGTRTGNACPLMTNHGGVFLPKKEYIHIYSGKKGYNRRSSPSLGFHRKESGLWHFTCLRSAPAFVTRSQREHESP
jgi:hypothetical protein